MALIGASEFRLLKKQTSFLIRSHLLHPFCKINRLFYSEDLPGAISSEAILLEIVQRDDNTGVRFGMDGKYKKAYYLYVGNNGKWVEHDVFASVSEK